jgi:hypothetical protein
MNNELRISILFSVIVVYNLFSSLKYTILLWICYLKVIDESNVRSFEIWSISYDLFINNYTKYLIIKLSLLKKAYKKAK